ncbi:MAG: TIGR04283 family arsenosugar biosynthesis glycosyltransferase [Desulfamplus sp.]|nr:TIGR04283 family arsenosugar biosynthesis glycosyltransferase [Desulfamplus sp.]
MKAYCPSFHISVIVPVLNEEEGINEFLHHIKNNIGNEQIEIILVDGDVHGGTIRKISHDEEIITLVSPPGRARQMNTGAAAAHGDILLFLHADTLLPRDAFKLVGKALEDKNYCGGAFDMGIDSSHLLLRAASLSASLKHRITRVPYGDQGIFIRSDFFWKIGGYSEIPLFEDVELMKRIKKMGQKIVILGSCVKTSPRKWKKEGMLYTIVRNWILQILYLAGVSPEYLESVYYGNRWRSWKRKI